MYLHARCASALFLCALLTSCGSYGGSNLHDFQVSEEDGITVAKSFGSPKYEGELFEYEPAFRLTQDPANEESLLFRPNDFMSGESGEVFVLDYSNSRIAVFDQNGAYIRSFGRDGQGPGEFSSMSNLLVHDGVVSVYDRSLRRRTRYDIDGNLLDTIQMPVLLEGVARGSWIDFQVLDNDLFFLLKWENWREGETDYFKAGIAVVRAAGDTVWTLDSQRVENGIYTTMASGMGLSFGLPFTSIPLVHRVPGRGIILSNGVAQELTWYDEEGAVLRRIDLGLPTEFFTQEDRNKVRARYEERLSAAREGDNPRLLESAEAQLRAFRLPSHKPAWSDVVVDEHGYLWLRVMEHTVDREEAGGGYLFRIVSPEGEYLCDSRIPYPTSRLWIGQGRMHVHWTPPDAEESVLQVCTIRSAVSGFEYP
ncbi:6-bladed beta-propeller [Gemmatimonadota bacterium]